MKKIQFKDFGFLLISTLLFISMPVQAMNKAELVDAITSNSGLSKADSKRALDSFISNTTSALDKGDKVSLIGFGTFSISKRAARKGRNPQTGKEIKIAVKYGGGSGGSILVRTDGITEITIDVASADVSSDGKLYMIPEVDDEVLVDSGMPNEYVFEIPSAYRFYKKRKFATSFQMPTTALTGDVGNDGQSTLFDGADAFLHYLPVMRPDVSDTSVAAGDLVEAAEALGFCEDAFVDLKPSRDGNPFDGHVTVLKIMSGQTGLTLKQLDSFFEAIYSMARGIEKSKIKRGNKVALVGFGSFSISNRAARTGRNPQTGKEIQIKAKKVAKFKAGAALATAVN